MQYNKKTYAALEENGKRRALAKTQKAKNFESAYRCEDCIERQEVSIPDPILIQLDLKQSDAQGWIRNTKNSACLDCRAHKRFLKDVPDYAALFTDSKLDDPNDHPLVRLLQNPPPELELIWQVEKQMREN